MIGIENSDLESRRFNMNIHRGTLEDLNIQELKKHIIDHHVDLLILRLPTINKSLYNKLSNIGYDVIHADSLVYYSVSLSNYQITDPRNNLEYEEIGQENVHLLKNLVPEIFKGYQNHYFSNPYLDKSKILDGYLEWASNYACNGENKISWYVKSKGKVVGFATCSFDMNTNECEGVLYGVLPEFSGRGIYSDIIRFTQKYFKGKGFKRMNVSTQLQNYSVQKVWIREGFFLNKAYETYHINSLLKFSITEKRKYKIFITEEMIANFAELSGDKNKLHFDTDYAKSLGFDDRISHGVLTQSFLSRIFGMDYPGEGTIFLSNNNLFLSPVYLNEGYELEISTLRMLRNGLIQLLAKIIDEKGKVCLLSYNNLINNSFTLHNS